MYRVRYRAIVLACLSFIFICTVSFNKVGAAEIMEEVEEKYFKDLSNTKLMSETGITIGQYTKYNLEDVYTIRFRDSPEIVNWLTRLYAAQLLLEFEGIVLNDKGKFLKDLIPITISPLEYITKYYLQALFETDNGYSLVESSLWMPLKNEYRDFPQRLVTNLGSAWLNANNLYTEKALFDFLAGKTPQLTMDFINVIDIDFDKSEEVRAILIYTLIDKICPNYVYDKARFYCGDKEIARMPIYSNTITNSMGYTPLTPFDTKDIQFKSDHKFPKIGNETPPEFTSANLRLFIYDTYNILTNQKPQTKIQKYVQEVFYAYNGEKLLDWNPKKDVAVDHNWTVTFNNQLDATTVNNKNFYIMYKGEQVTGINVSLNADKKSVKIEAPKEGYKPGETYSLYISKAVKSANNEHLYQPTKMDFTIEKVRLATKEELAKARYKTIIKDEKGDKYNLYMIPKREKLDNYGSYSGDYGFVLEKVGSDLAIWQKEEVQDYTFNEDLGIGEIGRTDMVSVTKGKTDSAFDLLVLSEKMTVNENFLRLYGIYKGKLIKLKFKGDTTGYSTLSANPPKFINSNTIQNVTYSNRDEDFGWEYENYRIDMESGLLIKEGYSIRYNDENWDEGNMIYERWIKDPNYFVQAESLPSVKWDGEWTRELPFNGGVLEIDNVKSSTFDFTLQVVSGAHADFMEGKAQINGNKATFSDTDTACKLTFTHQGESIDIEQAEVCARNAAFFNGEFALDPVLIEESLYPSVIDNKTVNEKFHELTGADYQRFYESMQLVSEDLYDNEVKGKVITGAVRGLFTLMEAIIIIGDDGYLYGAVINDGSVHYYTNNPDYKKRLPKSVLTWMERFNHYDVKYLTK